MLGSLSELGQPLQECLCEVDRQWHTRGFEEQGMKSSRLRPAAKLRHSLERKLAIYSLTAAGTGVALLSLVELSAQAEVVYTPTHLRLPFGVTDIDFNHDGVTDMIFRLSSSRYHIIERALSAQPLQEAGVAGYVGKSWNFASALRGGAMIGPRRTFFGGNPLMAFSRINHYTRSSTFSTGAWRDATGLYLGVKFNIDGAVHYGWVRLTVGVAEKLGAIVTGYAYETTANQPIRAGQTTGNLNESSEIVEAEPGDKAVSSLGRLAIGAARLTH